MSSFRKRKELKGIKRIKRKRGKPIGGWKMWRRNLWNGTRD